MRCECRQVYHSQWCARNRSTIPYPGDDRITIPYLRSEGRFLPCRFRTVAAEPYFTVSIPYRDSAVKNIPFFSKRRYRDNPWQQKWNIPLWCRKPLPVLRHVIEHKLPREWTGKPLQRITYPPIHLCIYPSIWVQVCMDELMDGWINRWMDTLSTEHGVTPKHRVCLRELKRNALILSDACLPP